MYAYMVKNMEKSELVKEKRWTWRPPVVFRIFADGRRYNGESAHLGIYSRDPPPVHASWVVDNTRFIIDYKPVMKSLRSEPLEPQV